MITLDKENRYQGFSDRLNSLCEAKGWPAKNRGNRNVMLRKALKNKGLPEISREAVMKWFNGNGMPEAYKIGYIADVLRVNANWLMTGKGEKYNSPGQESKNSESTDDKGYSKRIMRIADFLADHESEYSDLITGIIKTINKIQAAKDITELDNVNHYIIHNSNSHKS